LDLAGTPSALFQQQVRSRFTCRGRWLGINIIRRMHIADDRAQWRDAFHQPSFAIIEFRPLAPDHFQFTHQTVQYRFGSLDVV
jgi:hypothetical protein